MRSVETSKRKIPTKHKIKEYWKRRIVELTVVSVADRQLWRNKNRHYVCKCECGIVKIINSSDLASGNVNSCGCLKKQKNSKRLSTHGNSNHPLYGIWSGMIHRCTNKRMFFDCLNEETIKSLGPIYD